MYRPTIEEIGDIPPIHSTDHIPSDLKVIHAHFRGPCTSWYCAEFDANSGVFYGYVLYASSIKDSKWKTFSLDMLYAPRRANETVQRDQAWIPRQASDVDHIADTYRLQGRRWR